MGGLIPDRVGVYDYENNEGTADYKLQCYPLYSLLQAVGMFCGNFKIEENFILGNPTINLLSLDIEGAEYQILKTVPWGKVDIEVFQEP